MTADQPAPESLTEALANAPSIIAKGPRCTVATAAASLDEPDRSALLSAVNGAAWRAPDLEAVLRRRGIDLAAPAIRRHRLGHCACHKLNPDVAAT